MRGKLIKLDATSATELEGRRSSKDRTDETGKEQSDDPGNDEGRGRGPLPGSVLDQGRREAAAARIQGFDRLPRSERGEQGLGAVRLGWRRLAELRLRPGGPGDPARGRARRQAPGGGDRRSLQRLARRQCGAVPKRTCIRRQRKGWRDEVHAHLGRTLARFA